MRFQARPQRLPLTLYGRALAFLSSFLVILALTAGCSTTATHTAGTASTAACPSTYPIGYQIVPFRDGRSMAVWYPSDDPQLTYAYASDTSTTLAFNGKPLTGCGAFPLVIFSHGLGGCGTQSLFITETLARHGYVVAAPDHADALCHVSGSGPPPASQSEPSVYDPSAWTDTTYVDRKTDVELAISLMTSGTWASVTDASRIAIAGHSLGGYTALAMLGGWSSWRDDRIRAALLFSPYAFPFSIHQTLGAVHAPLMYQGADGDLGITPYVEGPTGAYGLSNPPKYFMKLQGGNHLTWTNVLCAGTGTIANCIATKPEAQLINAYGVAFLDRYLKGKASSLLTGTGAGLSAYTYQQ